MVELLVVIGIITVLIAMLFPVIQSARTQAQQVKCATNLRALGQGLVLYTQDHGYYPIPIYQGRVYQGHGSEFGHIAAWPVQIRRVMGGGTAPFYCPARPSEYMWEKRLGPPGQRVGQWPEGDVYAGPREVGLGYELGERLVSDWGRPFYFSYAYNGIGSRKLGLHAAAIPSLPSAWSRFAYLRATKVRRASEMIAIADAGWADFLLSSGHVSDIHRRGTNVLFCDGHVQWHARKEMEDPDGQMRRMWHYDNQP